MDITLLKAAKDLTKKCLNFITHSPSPWHVAKQARTMLLNSGFVELKEIDNWNLERGGKYFFSRNGSTVMAFQVGQQYDCNKTGFKIIGAHTDSPCLKLSPISKLSSHGFQQACVQLYGGGLWHTWFDRDLKLAGRIMTKDHEGKLSERLIDTERAVCYIPNLAIHLTQDRGKFEPNNENHLRPIFSTQIYSSLTGEKNDHKDQRHYYGLLNLIAEKLSIPISDIIDLDLCFAGVQPGELVGINEEFIASPRIDNLMSTFCALEAITSSELDLDSSFINVIGLFDHEEVGSHSFHGAGSTLLLSTLKRIFKLLKSNNRPDALDSAIQRSFCVSADQAHAIHPNYGERHQLNHQPKINQGVVLKINANQRYATELRGLSIMKQLAQISNVPLQEFTNKNDVPCGSTIGPIASSNTGIRTVDIGTPQLAMHSIRELGGVLDVLYYKKLMVEFYKSYEKISFD